MAERSRVGNPRYGRLGSLRHGKAWAVHGHDARSWNRGGFLQEQERRRESGPSTFMVPMGPEVGSAAFGEPQPSPGFSFLFATGQSITSIPSLLRGRPRGFDSDQDTAGVSQRVRAGCQASAQRSDHDPSKKGLSRILNKQKSARLGGRLLALSARNA